MLAFRLIAETTSHKHIFAVGFLSALQMELSHEKKGIMKRHTSFTNHGTAIANGVDLPDYMR